MPATELLIGLDPMNRACTIRQIKEGREFCYTTNIHCGDGFCYWGITSARLNDFLEIKSFPSFYAIWPEPDLDYARQCQKQRIYSIAVHHAVKLP